MLVVHGLRSKTALVSSPLPDATPGFAVAGSAVGRHQTVRSALDACDRTMTLLWPRGLAEAREGYSSRPPQTGPCEFANAAAWPLPVGEWGVRHRIAKDAEAGPET